MYAIPGHTNDRDRKWTSGCLGMKVGDGAVGGRNSTGVGVGHDKWYMFARESISSE